MQEKDIEILKTNLQELQEVREQSANASKLMEALQGEQLGASRAVSQNKELKKQLEEMHDAFIQLVCKIFRMFLQQKFEAFVTKVLVF